MSTCFQGLDIGHPGLCNLVQGIRHLLDHPSTPVPRPRTPQQLQQDMVSVCSSRSTLTKSSVTDSHVTKSSHNVSVVEHSSSVTMATSKQEMVMVEQPASSVAKPPMPSKPVPYSGSAFDNPHRNGTHLTPEGTTERNHGDYDYVNGEVKQRDGVKLPPGIYDKLTPGRSVVAPPSEDEINHSWSQIVSAADMVNGKHVDLLLFVDEQLAAAAAEQDEKESVGQSTAASSGYHSFLAAEPGSPPQPPLSFTNPMYNNSQLKHYLKSSPRDPPPIPHRSTKPSSGSSPSQSAPALPPRAGNTAPRHQPRPQDLPVTLCSSETRDHNSGQQQNQRAGRHRAESPVLTNELSKSAEFSHLRRQQTVATSTVSAVPAHSPYDPRRSERLGNTSSSSTSGIQKQRALREHDTDTFEVSS